MGHEILPEWHATEAVRDLRRSERLFTRLREWSGPQQAAFETSWLVTPLNTRSGQCQGRAST